MTLSTRQSAPWLWRPARHRLRRRGVRRWQLRRLRRGAQGALDPHSAWPRVWARKPKPTRLCWAAQNGADVISCSWGPVDGRWWDANDPKHNLVAPLPDSTRLAIDFASEPGARRQGLRRAVRRRQRQRGVDNDGYASYPKVIAVAACNDQGKKSAVQRLRPSRLVRLPEQRHRRPASDQRHLDHRQHGPAGYNPGQTQQGDAARQLHQQLRRHLQRVPGRGRRGRPGHLRAIPSCVGTKCATCMKNACERSTPQGGNYDANGHSAAIWLWPFERAQGGRTGACPRNRRKIVTVTATRAKMWPSATCAAPARRSMWPKPQLKKVAR